MPRIHTSTPFPYTTLFRSVQVGQQGVPAVTGGFGVDSGLVERPGQGWLALLVDANVGTQVSGHPPIPGNGRDAGRHGGLVGVVAAAQTTPEAVQAVSGPGQFLGPG